MDRLHVRRLARDRVRDSQRLERLECLENRGRRRDQIRDEALIDVQKPLVLALIPHLVALVEYPPDVWTESERMRKQLENDVAMTGSVSSAS